MRIKVYIDESNFYNNILCVNEERKQDRVIDHYKINKFVLNYLSKNLQYQKQNLMHIRTYLYDGEYSDTVISKIKYALSVASGKSKEKFKKLLTNVEKNAEGQKKKFKKMDGHYFFEVRKKPLQFQPNKGIFQKGVDVQLAVDLVSDAYLNTYDIAVLFSGDIDLLESIKLVKGLGKHVVIFSHYKNMAVEMRRIADLYVNMQNLKDEQLDEFTHTFQKKDNEVE